MAWAVYTAAAGSALSMTGKADAGIVYSGVQNLTASIPNTGTFQSSLRSIPLAGVPSAPIYLGVYFATFSGDRYGNASLYGVPSLSGKLLLNTSAEVKKLASGAKISAGAGAFGSGFRYLKAFNTSGTTAGTWPSRSTGFAGFQFGSPGHLHYGWIRLRWEDTDGINPFPNKIVAIDWAYESVENKAILAGAVPEPGSLGLSLLAGGAIGVYEFRRRRKAAAAAKEAASA